MAGYFAGTGLEKFAVCSCRFPFFYRVAFAQDDTRAFKELRMDKECFYMQVTQSVTRFVLFTYTYVQLLAKEGVMRKAVLPLVVLLAFTAYTAFVMSQAEQSLVQFGIELMSSLDTAQVVIDLYILATLACVWMYQDNKARNKPFIAIAPYIVITAVFVSIGPLLYLVIRGLSKESSAGET